MQHDLDKGHLNEEQKSYFETHAVWLCARREDVGKRNGRKLAHLAEDEQRFLHQLYTEHEETKYMNKHASTHIDFSTEKHDEITNDQEASSPLEISTCAGMCSMMIKWIHRSIKNTCAQVGRRP